MKSVKDFTLYDFKREESINGKENNVDQPSAVKSNENRTGSSYFLECEELVSKKHYVLNFAGYFSNTDAKLACSLSDHQTAIYNLTNDKLHSVKTFPAHGSPISNTRFARDKDSHVYTSSLDGTIKLWDLRNNCQLTQTFSGGDSIRPITCFDISCDGRFICAGTEDIGGTAFLLFWDVRSTKLLGGYWESHVEDLTQVAFHPDKKSCMITGGMDGLINVFDIKKSCEDDALVNSLNTELSVEKLGWLHEDDSLYCLTHSCDLQLWKLTDSSPAVQFKKQSIATALNVKYSENLYLVNLHEKADENYILLGGSNAGNGESPCVTSVIANKSFSSPRSLIGNKQVVRSSVYDSKNEILVTAGEKGIINVWKGGKVSNHDNSNNKLKGHNQKNKAQRIKPY